MLKKSKFTKAINSFNSLTGFNYQKICDDILKDLPTDRSRDVIRRRFGFGKEKKETLELIGKSYGITRERVRQIEEDGLKRARVGAKKISQEPFQYFSEKLKNFGGLKKEDLFLEELGGQKFKPQVLFLLNLEEQFERFSETEDFYPFWTLDKNSLDLARKIIDCFDKELRKSNQPLTPERINFPDNSNLTPNVLSSYIEISKNILKGPEGLYGFSEWPEINPRGIKDKAFLVLKRENKPLHFSQVAQLIQKQENSNSPSLVKTVHNELIKDQRFVLVGRGLYALKDWGYKPGVVKEVIFDVLKNSGNPLSSKEIIEKVLTQRFVQKNTILLNLQNKKYFLRDSEGKYTIKEA
jgi:hypothetical protein